MNTYRTSANGVSLIKHFESFKAQAYICPAGVLTIGYGTTTGVRSGQTINESKASTLLAEDLRRFEAEVKSMVRVPLNQYQFDALVSFAYNVGSTRLRQSTLLRVLNAGQYQLVAAQFLRWNRGGGRVLAGLTRRRKSEMFLWQTGGLKFDF
jgi:lysozyme